MINKNILNRTDATNSISRSKVNGRPCDEFIELTGIRKPNIKSLPRDIQKEVEDFIGTRSATILVRKS